MIDVLSFPAPDWSNRPSRRAAKRALSLNESGRAELDAGHLDEAERLFMESIGVVPLIGMPWFNLGLIYKMQLRWQESAACNQRSIDLGTDDPDPAFWNLGIAATALRDWDTARRAWISFGITIEPGDGAIAIDLGPSPLRINPAGDAEVVWGRRIDPARILIESIPLPGSGHRWHDVVLHDGHPSGQRTLGEHTLPVFDELQRWQPSPTPTSECMLTGSAEAVQDLSERFQSEGWALEDWTGNIRMLCQTCSDGHPGKHTHGAFTSDTRGSHVGIAAPEDVAEPLLEAWLNEETGRGRTAVIPVGD